MHDALKQFLGTAVILCAMCYASYIYAYMYMYIYSVAKSFVELVKYLFTLLDVTVFMSNRIFRDLDPPLQLPRTATHVEFITLNACVRVFFRNSLIVGSSFSLPLCLC